MSAPTTPLKWSPKKAAARSPGGGGGGTGGGLLGRSRSGTGPEDGSNGRSNSTSSKGKMRAIFCDVVVEDVNRTEAGWEFPPEIQSFLPCLGTSLEKPTSSPAFPSTPSRAALDEAGTSTSRPPDLERLRNLLLELESTEGTYVRRLKVLHKLYAHPLRDFARNRDTEIIPLFDAKLMFGNIEAILPANEAFLHDLKASLHPVSGYRAPEHWANVMLRHLHHFSTLYPAYILNLEGAKSTERELRRRNTAFRNFIERTRSAAGEGHDNCSLESLLIEAAQRIPRYRLLLKGIVKEVDARDPARPAMLEAIEVASSIAALDENEHTRRAAALYGLGRAIEGFPARMTSRHRYFIDCIDVLDTRLSPAAATSAPGSGYSSHTDDLLCTLFLFNDRILVAKRDSAEGTGRSIVGLNNINKLVQDMQGKDAALSRSRSPMKGRGKAMRYRGDYDLGEVIANDLGEYGFSLFLDRAPTEFSERWNGRPLRHFVIIKPERPEDKTRFLSNIWHCMAQNKTEKKGPRAMLLRQNQLSVYWNIYDRRSYLSETRKARMALQLAAIDDFQPLSQSASAPAAVAEAILYEDGMCDYSLRLRGSAETRLSAISQASIVTNVLEAALRLRLHDPVPKLPGSKQPLETSRGSTSSRQLSASSNRPKSVLDFMLSPSSSVSSPRRTLSKASKTSTQDSHRTGTGSASIFSQEYASTAHTSVHSHEAQDGFASAPSPHKRPATSAGCNAPGSAPSHIRSNSDMSRQSAGHSAQNTRNSWYEENSGLHSGREVAEARPAVQGSSTGQLQDAVEEIDQGVLSRSRSDSALYKSSSEQSIARSHGETLTRATSTQSMRIEEEIEDLLEGTAQQSLSMPRTPPQSCLSPPLQRSGTISRPYGPRQLGSRSPAASPVPVLPALDRGTPRPYDRRTPSPLFDDEDSPFLSSQAELSLSKKRGWADEAGDDEAASIASKRALRSIGTPQRPSPQSRAEPVAKGRTPSREDAQNVCKDARQATRQSSISRVGSVRQDRQADLQRQGSLPRSPHTRSLYMQSRVPGPPSQSTGQAALSAKGPAAGVSRIPRKPAPGTEHSAISQTPADDDDVDMEIALVRKESLLERAKHAEERKVLQARIEELQQQVADGRSEAETLKLALGKIEAAHETEMEIFAEQTIQMANSKLDSYVATTDVKMRDLEAENERLRKERKALQALLRSKSASG